MDRCLSVEPGIIQHSKPIHQKAGLVLSIIGASQAAISAAVFASSNTGEAVGLQTPGLTAAKDMQFSNVHAPVRLDPGVLPDAHLFTVVSDSGSLKNLIYEHRHILAGKSVLLAPGGFAGVLRVLAWFREWRLSAPRVAEVTGFLVGGKRDADGGRFRLGSAKEALPLASHTEDLTHQMLAEFLPYFPNLVASTLVTTSLSNTNHMIHPGIVLLNAARIDRGEAFTFYREGLSPAVGDFLEALDQERLEVATALEAEALSLREWLLRFYGKHGMQGETLLECLQSFPSYGKTPSPPSLDYRYLTDDVPYGVAQYLRLSSVLGTSSQHLRTVVDLATLFLGKAAMQADEESARLFRAHLDQR